MTAYYNEFDPYAAEWLRNLITAGLIAPGEVDDRSIDDVSPIELAGFTQCHFFAGVGVWSHALRGAGWPDDRPVWTGSCPCQPFSAAGKGDGFDDERHKWPAWFHLIGQCRPPTVFGEQVAKKDGLAWLDLVQADLEDLDYACGAVVAPAAGFGAPHIRERQYWAADDLGRHGARELGDRRRPRLEGHAGDGGRSRGPDTAGPTAATGAAGALSQSDERERGRRPDDAQRLSDREAGRRNQGAGDAERGDGAVELADGAEFGRIGRRTSETGVEPGTLERSERSRDVGGLHDSAGARREPARKGSESQARDETRLRGSERGRGLVELGVPDSTGPQPEWTTSKTTRHGRSSDAASGFGGPGPTNGFWRDADWLHCRDGKWRPVRPGTFPLVNGAPSRVGRLRAYGNAIVAPQAQAFIEAAMEVLP